MKAFLMYPDRDFDTERELPPNEADLSSDLELDVLLQAMADGDKFLFAVARHGIHSGLASPGGDRLPAARPGRLHRPARRGPRPVRRRAWRPSPRRGRSSAGSFRDSPDSILHRPRQVLELYVGRCSAG